MSLIDGLEDDVFYEKRQVVVLGLFCEEFEDADVKQIKVVFGEYLDDAGVVVENHDFIYLYFTHFLLVFQAHHHLAQQSTMIMQQFMVFPFPQVFPQHLFADFKQVLR